MNCWKKAGIGATLILLLGTVGLRAQVTWPVPEKDRDIQLDGFIEEWGGVPKLVLEPSAPGVRSQGEFKNGDLQIAVQALWTPESLYLAVEWQDDLWDVQEVKRGEAVWISPEKQRRNRMLFFDNLNLSLRHSDYDFTLWISPRVKDQGPFLWHRLLEGLSGIESATVAPLVAARFLEDRVTLEMVLLWRELKIKARSRARIPLDLLASDSDLPGERLEVKANHLKSLQWSGDLQLAGR